VLIFIIYLHVASYERRKEFINYLIPEEKVILYLYSYPQL